MRWLLKVSAEYLKSRTGSANTLRRHGTSSGAGSLRGAWLRSPALTSSRNTPRRSSSTASPSGPEMRLTTVVKTSVPVPPRLTEMSASSVLLRERLADPDRPVKAKCLSREHAARQRHRGDDAGRRGRTVGPQLVREKARKEVENRPARRQRVAVFKLRLRAHESQA